MRCIDDPVEGDKVDGLRSGPSSPQSVKSLMHIRFITEIAPPISATRTSSHINIVPQSFVKTVPIYIQMKRLR
jgi:hypothetical protein